MSQEQSCITFLWSMSFDTFFGFVRIEVREWIANSIKRFTVSTIAETPRNLKPRVSDEINFSSKHLYRGFDTMMRSPGSRSRNIVQTTVDYNSFI